MSTFLLKCSCVLCKREITTQSLSSHIKSHTPKRQCRECGDPIYTNTKVFCSASCSATFNNRARVGSGVRSGPVKGTRPSTYVPYTKVGQCGVCHRYFKQTTGNKKTCSSQCKNILLSWGMKQRIDRGFNPNQHRGRNKRSYLEQSFSGWLASHFPSIEVRCEAPFKRKDATKTYFADFYFPVLQLIIELDGTQHKDAVEYDKDRDSYIQQEYGVRVVRISHREYTQQTRVDEIVKLLTAL